MHDYADVHMLGRATQDATFHTHPTATLPYKATFSIACNVPVRTGGQLISRTVYRRIMVLSPFAQYLLQCQEEDGLKGRLIVLRGVMDNEISSEEHHEVIRVGQPDGSIKVIDRRK